MYLLLKKINRIDNFEHWSESIKTTIEWFTFLDIMEYTGNDMISDIPLTTSLLKIFSMFGVKMTVRDVNQTEKMDRLFKTYITPQLKEIYQWV